MSFLIPPLSFLPLTPFQNVYIYPYLLSSLSAEQTMRSFWFLPLLLFLVAAPADSYAAPLSTAGFSPSKLCQVPYLKDFSPIKELCKRSSGSVQVKNPPGKAMSGGVMRFSGKYATAARWEAPVISSQWTPAYVVSVHVFSHCQAN
jgi:hypothetical protein